MQPQLIDSAKTILLPASLYGKESEQDYLCFNGMAPAADEYVVASKPHRGIVAIMATPVRVFNRRVVTTPLFEAIAHWTDKREVNILLTVDNVYVAVRENGVLRYAEVFPDNSADSILYYMQVLSRGFELSRFMVNVSGTGDAAVAETLRDYFRQVQIVRFEE